MTRKEKILKILEDLPDDVEIGDAMDRLYLLYKIEKGIEQADRGELMTVEEARRRMAEWRRP